MIKRIFIISLLFLSVMVKAQEEKTSLDGTITDFEDKKPLVGANIFNLTSLGGTSTDNDGRFDLMVKPNDTIYVSHIGYQSIKLHVTNDLLKGNKLAIELHKKIEELEEVVVKTHQLVGVLEIDIKNVPKDKNARIHINGLPQTYEVGKPKKANYSSPLAAIFNPVDFVYNLFGKEPKQLKKLKKLSSDDKLRALMDKKVDRELMMEYLKMTPEEFNKLLNQCNYSDYFIKKASDLQLIEAILACYENYKAVKNGSTTKKD
ncbi:MAG: TonB-dependent receptor [Candidatus Delongbacteria bacterium]|nr:MAG: TonB-dependent receptor [Candidatus Delongbacteria bacterium]